MPQRFAKQLVVAVLACIAIGSAGAWADNKYQQRADPPFQQRMAPNQQRVDPYQQRMAPYQQRMAPSQQRVDPYQQRVDPYQQRADPYQYQQRMDPRDGGLPASVRRIQRETGGQVLRAQPIQRDGREVYRVKVLTPQGRIRVVEEIPPPPSERTVPMPPHNDPPPPMLPRNHWPE